MLTDEMCVEIAKTAVPKVLEVYPDKNDKYLKLAAELAVDAALIVLKEYERLKENQ